MIDQFLGEIPQTVDTIQQGPLPILPEGAIDLTYNPDAAPGEQRYFLNGLDLEGLGIRKNEFKTYNFDYQQDDSDIEQVTIGFTNEGDLFLRLINENHLNIAHDGDSALIVIDETNLDWSPFPSAVDASTTSLTQTKSTIYSDYCGSSSFDYNIYDTDSIHIELSEESSEGSPWSTTLIDFGDFRTIETRNKGQSNHLRYLEGDSNGNGKIHLFEFIEEHGHNTNTSNENGIPSFWDHHDEYLRYKENFEFDRDNVQSKKIIDRALEYQFPFE